MNLEVPNEHLKHIIDAYKKKVEYDHDRYHNKVKHDPEQMEKRRELSRQHYHKNKEKKKEYYQKNKEKLRLINFARYYKDDLDKLKQRYPLEYDLIVEYNLIPEPPNHDAPIPQTTSPSSLH
jgi:hypothetical protein